MKKLAFLLAFALLSAFVLSNSSTTTAGNTSIVERFTVGGALEEGAMGAYTFDPNHASIGFRVKHMGLIDVHGYFRAFDGKVNYDPKDVTKSTVEFTAKMTSVDTGVDRRDNHLRTADFFRCRKIPRSHVQKHEGREKRQ
jgi:polyisoprenoid-binding protein YceI